MSYIGFILVLLVLIFVAFDVNKISNEVTEIRKLLERGAAPADVPQGEGEEPPPGPG